MYTIEKITTLIGARRYGKADSSVSFVLTDSRSLSFPEETLFFAIKTQRNDGHKYIDDLYRRGVRSFVIETLPKSFDTIYPEANFLKVTNSLEALQRLAERHRDEFSIPIIGITGSNGKTTVKEWLYQLLYRDVRVTRSPRSYNSQIGVPMSVWLLNDQSEIGIFEAGISMPGEMEQLREMIQPTIAVLTNIGAAHQENFRNMREKCEEKLLLLRDAEVAIYSADDETISNCMRRSDFRGMRLAWSMRNENAAMYISNVASDDARQTTTISYTICKEKKAFQDRSQYIR